MAPIDGIQNSRLDAAVNDPFWIDPEIKKIFAKEDEQTEIITPETIVAARIESDERLRCRPQAGSREPTKHTIQGVGGPLDLWFFDGTKDGQFAPCMIWFHGGGYVKGHGRDLWYGQFFSEFAGCSVLSVNYRLAPENRAPAPVEDGIAALEWLLANAPLLGVDGARIAIGGASAGAGVAAGLALKIRDIGGPRVALQLLLYPMLDRNHEATRALAGRHPVWWRDLSLSCWSMYLGPDPAAEILPYAAVSEAADLRDLPPARLFVGTADLFHDEVKAFHNRLLDNGIDSVLRTYPGMVHGGEVSGSRTAIGRKMCQDYLDVISDSLGTRSDKLP